MTMELRVGQVWVDTLVTGEPRWTVKVMKINRASARVERCQDHGVYALLGSPWQYRMERRYFENGRMMLLHDVLPS